MGGELLFGAFDLEPKHGLSYHRSEPSLAGWDFTYQASHYTHWTPRYQEGFCVLRGFYMGFRIAS